MCACVCVCVTMTCKDLCVLSTQAVHNHVNDFFHTSVQVGGVVGMSQAITRNLTSVSQTGDEHLLKQDFLFLHRDTTCAEILCNKNL